MEWDYANLSLVEALSPTPAHNCQERQAESEGEREGGSEGVEKTSGREVKL